MEKHTVVQNIVLEELANGNGKMAEKVLKKLHQLEILGVDTERYKAAVFELFDATLIGLTKENNISYEKLVDLGRSLVKITNRIDAEVYEYLFMPLVVDSAIDFQASIGVIQAGSKILRIKEGKDKFPGMNIEKFMSTVKTVLLYMAKKKSPEVRSRVVELLSNFNGSDVKQNLDEMTRGKDMWIREAAEESIAIVRAREDLKLAMNHEKAFMGLYPYEGHPKRYFVSAVYGSMRLLMLQTNERKIADTVESVSAVGHLTSLAKSFPSWKEEVFYDNPQEAEILKEDIQNVLFHVVKRAGNEGMAREAAAALATQGDKRVTDIFGKILKRRESGYQLISRYTIPKPKVRARALPPSAPHKKVASR